MSQRFFNLCICEPHQTIIGLQHSNTNFVTKCCGNQCQWVDCDGLIELNDNNVVVYFEIGSDVASKINSGEYGFGYETVLCNLYDNEDQYIAAGIQAGLQCRVL